jgi:hypothetical protein
MLQDTGDIAASGKAICIRALLTPLNTNRFFYPLSSFSPQYNVVVKHVFDLLRLHQYSLTQSIRKMFLLDRRSFLKFQLVSLGRCILVGVKHAEKSRFMQKIIINLPAYRLTLINFFDDELKAIYNFPIGIGMGFAEKSATPVGQGYIYEKRKRIIFRYPRDYPHLKINKGDIIKWTNTYSDEGVPVGYRMPYSKMRALGMKIFVGEYSYKKYVIHSTTNQFTIRTPATRGCIRLDINNMLKLYDLISPQFGHGRISPLVPIDIVYEPVEITQDSIELHADIYNMKIDYIQEVTDELSRTYRLKDCNLKDLENKIAKVKVKFNETHKQILKILLNDYPDNYVSPSLKKNLHFTLNISDVIASKESLGNNGFKKLPVKGYRYARYTFPSISAFRSYRSDCGEHRRKSPGEAWYSAATPRRRS